VVASSTQKPGTYTSLSVTYTDADGATAVDEFDLVVNGFKVVTDNGRTYTGFVVNSNGKCLDMRNASGGPSAGLLMQTWTCGAGGGKDQRFIYNTVNKQLVYDAGANTYCVAEIAPNARAELEPCNGSLSGDETLFHSTDGHWSFANGDVLDNAAHGRGNGNHVLSYAFNGGRNQLWTLPS
jgi:Ricin-type beta-trefoil lectin domain